MKTEIGAYKNGNNETVRFFQTDIGTVLLRGNEITVSFGGESCVGASGLNAALEMIEAEYNGEDFPNV